MKKITGIRKLPYDDLWHAMWTYEDGTPTYDRVTRAEAVRLFGMLTRENPETGAAVEDSEDEGDEVAEITQVIAKHFRSFGGGRTSEWNPITAMLADKPPQFAAGVDISEVVRCVLLASKARKEAQCAAN